MPCLAAGCSLWAPQPCPFRHSGCLFSGWVLELLGWHERKGLFFPQLAQESGIC